MEYTTLGRTGMTVSRICLGCMGFGTGREWMLDPEESTDLIDRAIDLGINFFDTANVYSTGESEEILGEALGEYDRNAQVVATKVFSEMDPDDSNAQGSREKRSSRNSKPAWPALDSLGLIKRMVVSTIGDPTVGTAVTLYMIALFAVRNGIVDYPVGKENRRGRTASRRGFLAPARTG